MTIRLASSIGTGTRQRLGVFYCVDPNRRRSLCAVGTLPVAGIRWASPLAVLALSFALATSVQADSVILRIRAINPSQTETQKVEVKATLPKPAKPEDVLDRGELEIAYDVHDQSYYVRKEVELEPKEVRTYQIELRDIWVVPEDELRELGGHATALAEALRGTEQGDTANQLRAAIEGNLKAVKNRQAECTVARVRPIEHIRAYESNLETLARVRKDLALMENLAVLAGKDPKKILGPSAAGFKTTPESGSATGSMVVIRIQVKNPSLTMKQTVPVKRDLPVEIRSTDVVDAGGLNVGYDASRNLCYVYIEALELGPQETREFEVRARNPWAASAARIVALEARLTNVLAVAKESEAYQSVQDKAQGVLQELAGVRGQQGPDVLNEEYVAFYRQQASRLASVEDEVVRLEELFQPRERPLRWSPPLLNVKPPTPKTTWVIIYIVIGFLGVISLLFFLRWYGKSKAEQLARISLVKTAGEERRPAGGAQMPVSAGTGAEGQKPA